MADIYYPVVNGDDGFRDSTGNFFTTANFLPVGTDSGGVLQHCFVRFPSVAIPNGSFIADAFIRFTAYSSLGGVTCNVNCYFEDSDDAIAPINGTEFDALSLTGAVVWNAVSAQTDGTQYDTPSLVTILQNIVDRVGWASGNAVQIVIKDNSSSVNAYRYLSAINYLSGAEKAELHVTWAPNVHIDSNVDIPMATAEGLTGIYSAPSIPMAIAEGFTGIYSAPSFPMIRANGTLSDNMVHIQSDVTIPSMTAAITQAKQIWGDVTVPMMTAELTERETVLGAATIPMMTAELSSGSHADVSITAPMMTATGLFSGRCAVTVPMMTAAITGKVGRVGNISVKLPMMTVSVIGKTEHLGNISVTVPMMYALAELITGKSITGAATLPMMTAALSSYEDLTGDIDVSIPMMVDYLSGTTARFTSCAVVLRFEEPV